MSSQVEHLATTAEHLMQDGFYLCFAGSEDGTARVWDLRSRQCLRFVKSPNKAPITTALVAPWPVYLSGHQSSMSGGRQGPKRQQTLAPLAKFAGRKVYSTTLHRELGMSWQGSLTAVVGEAVTLLWLWQ